jgi:hypothetical protein
MQELSSSMTRKTIVPPSISTSGSSSCTDTPFMRLVGDDVVGDIFEGRFSAVGFAPKDSGKLGRLGLRGCTEMGSGIGAEGVCTGVDVGLCTSPERLLAETEAFGCGVSVFVSSEIVTISASPFLMPISVMSLSQVSGEPRSTAFDGYAILRPI